MGLDLSRIEIQSLEQRLVLAAPEIGDTTGEFQLSVDGFRGGFEARVIDGVLYYPGSLPNGVPSAATVDLNILNLGQASILSFSGSGAAFTPFRIDGVVRFAGFTDGGQTDATLWTSDNIATVFPDSGNSVFNASNIAGRMVGDDLSSEGGFAVYADAGDAGLTRLPQVVDVDLSAQAITKNGWYIGASGFDDDGEFRVVVYELVGEEYQIFKDSYPTSDGFDTF